MASYPRFLGTTKVGIVAISTANTNRDGTGTIGTVFSAGTNGSRVMALTVQATVTTTAGMVRLYIHNGTTAYLWREIPVTAITPSASLPAFVDTMDCSDDSPENILVLPTGYSLRASTHNAEAFNVIAIGGDY